MVSKPLLCGVLGSWLLLAGGAARATAQDANRDVVVSVSDVGGVIDRIVSRSDKFKDEFKKALDKSILDHSKLEDRADQRGEDLHNAAKKLQDVFKDKKDKNDPDVRKEVDKTLAAAGDVNMVMNKLRFTDELQKNWELLRGDLNGLAAVYSLSPIR
jgi:basic membrane lipoprotein Med (substrate-binding protein (PBP1-ABC) superfamily)